MGCKSDTQNKIVRKKKAGNISGLLLCLLMRLILAYVTMGIADLSQGAGKLLLITVALAYGSTLIAGSASFGMLLR